MTNEHEDYSKFGKSMWLRNGTPAWREWLQTLTGKLSETDERMTRGDAGYETCTYCGSITPQHFIELCGNTAAEIEVADWKYGYPHKVYINADGKHLKFYFIHLHDLEDLNSHTALIQKRTNIEWTSDAEGIKWKGTPRGRYDGA